MGWRGAACTDVLVQAFTSVAREITSIHECVSQPFSVCRRGRRRYQRSLCSQLAISSTARHSCMPKGAPLSGNCGYQVDRNSERLCRLSCKAAAKPSLGASCCQDITYIYGPYSSVAASLCGVIIAHLCDIFEYSECLGQSTFGVGIVGRGIHAGGVRNCSPALGEGRHKARPYLTLIGEQRAGTRPAPT